MNEFQNIIDEKPHFCEEFYGPTFIIPPNYCAILRDVLIEAINNLHHTGQSEYPELMTLYRLFTEWKDE